MIAILQRVSEAQVHAEGKKLGEIGSGLMVLLAVCEGDSEEEMVFLCDKMADLRLFPDEKGRMNYSLLQIGGEILLISQFTLCADWLRGRRPGFTKAAAPERAEELYEKAKTYLQSKGIRVASGLFGADMKISQSDDGPVTLILDPFLL